jgi:guanylate kinase
MSPTSKVQGPKSEPAAQAASLLIVISAPSGGGKTTLCNELLAAQPGITRAVTATTRAPRPGERDGIDYHFLTPAEFQRRVAAGEFVEHATVFGRSYGVLRSELLGKLRSGMDVLLNIDVQGAATIRARAQAEPELRRALVSIFLTPPSLTVLETRLRKRNADSEAEIQKRLAEARQELAHWNQFDYLVISTSVAEDLRRALVVLAAERMRAVRAPAPEF